MNREDLLDSPETRMVQPPRTRGDGERLEDIPFLLAELERVTKERDELANEWNLARAGIEEEYKNVGRTLDEALAERNRLREALGVAKDTLKLYANGEDAGFPYAQEALAQISRIEAGGDGKE